MGRRWRFEGSRTFPPFLFPFFPPLFPLFPYSVRLLGPRARSCAAAKIAGSFFFFFFFPPPPEGRRARSGENSTGISPPPLFSPCLSL